MSHILTYLTQYLAACWQILIEMAPYICFGFFIAGLLHMFVNTQTIMKYLAKGRVKSVIYAALFGVPLPLCSCGVLPMAAGLKKQGASNGAILSFLIATPETGVDSIAVTYALLDPIMTVFRPIAAFFTAIVAGLSENFFGKTYNDAPQDFTPDLSCKVDHCCDGDHCPPEKHRKHHTFLEKLTAGIRYGFGDILNDLAKWLVIGIAVAGAITVVIPEHLFENYLHGGLTSMLVMMAIGIPLYICATASTPIAAALILKGISPGAALVFMLTGPATNAATISVVYGLLRKRTTAIYLSSIAICSILMGLLLDQIYAWSGVSARAIIGSAGEVIPEWLSVPLAIGLLVLLLKSLASNWMRASHADHDDEHGHACCDHGCSHNG